MNAEEVRELLEHMTNVGYTPVARVQALSALYIGDGLREIAQAITNSVPLPPTEADLAKETAASGPPAPHKQCGNCQHWIMGINTGGRFDAYCDYAPPPVLLMRLDGRCTGFVKRSTEALGEEADLDKEMARQEPCWNCRFWRRSVFGYFCKRGDAFSAKAIARGSCRGWKEKEQ